MGQSIEDIQEEIVEDFQMFDDWEDKYEYIIELGNDLPQIDEQYKTDDHLIKGCQSNVWLRAEMEGGTLKFTADSDAIITKGIIALLIQVLSGHTPSEVAHANLDFIDRIGLKEHLSPTRANGLVNMVKQMKAYGLAYQARNEGVG